MTTLFERCYLLGEPALPVLYGTVRRHLKELVQTVQQEGVPRLLDVGGRKSHYTIGLPVAVTITDLPRQTELQERCRLGINEQIMATTRRRRSNLAEILLDDMTHSSIADQSFDLVVAVEVLEHVDEDALFVRQVQRVLRPGGIFLMTTPNGDYLGEPTHPDHRRHYRRQQLHELLTTCFAPVSVRYIVAGGRWRRLGLKGLTLRRPLRSLLSMTGNLVNAVQSAPASVATRAIGTHHLLAVARKEP